MTPFVRLTRQPVLAREDEQREEDGLERYGHCQERKRNGVIPRIASTLTLSRHRTSDVQDEHWAAARGAGNPIAELFAL